MTRQTRASSPLTSPDFFLAGFQKCATTWLHRSLREHPQIHVADPHMIHFFDINFHLGPDWYHQFFSRRSEHQLLGDTTATYARDANARNRIGQCAPDSKIILSVRNPIDRAVSHYLHERTKGKTNFSFNEWRENYDCFCSWILPGLYAQHLEHFLKLFSQNQVLVLVADDFRDRPLESLRRLFDFLGVDREFRPSTIGQSINSTDERIANSHMMRHSQIQRIHRFIGAFFRTADIHQDLAPAQVVSAEERAELADVFSADVKRLEELTGYSLNHWLEGNL